MNVKCEGERKCKVGQEMSGCYGPVINYRKGGGGCQVKLYPYKKGGGKIVSHAEGGRGGTKYFRVVLKGSLKF